MRATIFDNAAEHGQALMIMLFPVPAGAVAEKTGPRDIKSPSLNSAIKTYTDADASGSGRGWAI